MEVENINILDQTANDLFRELDLHTIEGTVGGQLHGASYRAACLDTIKHYLQKYATEIQPATPEELISSIIETPQKAQMFDKFWEAYGKRIGKTAVEKKWFRLKITEMQAILENVPYFVAAHPDLQFRPNPLTYVNQRRWEDELPNKPKKQTPVINKTNSWNYDKN